MVQTLTRSAARIYGTLSALGEGSMDILERLLPFFDPILRPKHGKRFAPDAIAREIRDTYKWNFNTDIVEVFVPRLVDAGWLAPDSPDIQQTTYTITMTDEIEASATENSVNTQLRRIAEQFKAFSESLSPLTAIPLQVEEFEDILIEWLLYVEAFSEHNLNFKTGIRKDDKGKLSQIVEVPRTTSLTDEEAFLCARFVQHAINTDPNTAEILARIASIGLLTEVVQDFVRPSTPVETSNLAVYLDAPVALELLGVSGTSARDNIQPIISELQKIGANIRIFEQSVEEAKHSLQAVLQNPRPTGPTAQALARGDVIRDYVTAVSMDPEPFLQKLGVHLVRRSLDQYPAEIPYFTEEHRTEIYNSLAFQQNLRARDHDADITTLVMRQRRGYGDPDIFKTRFLIITRNGLLAQIVRRKCIEMGSLAPKAVPPVVHRRVLAASMWLRTGLGANNLDIPKRMLLASCERVLAIRPGVVEAVKRLTDALGDKEKARQLDLLIAQDRSAQMLMDKTLGAPSVVTEENLPVLFQEMLHPHLEEEKQKGDAAVKEAKTQGQKQLDTARAQLRNSEHNRLQTAAKLDAKLEEDHDVVEALCEEIARHLTKRRMIIRFVAGVIAIGSAIPLVCVSTLTIRAISVVITGTMGYLTVTGGRLFGTGTDEKLAFRILRTIAAQRHLSSKLDQFCVTWNGTHFLLTEQKATTPSVSNSELF